MPGVGGAPIGRVAGVFDGREMPPLLPPDRPRALIRALATLHRGLFAYFDKQQELRR